MREALEETGLTVAVGRPVFLSDSIDPAGSRHVVNIAFLARVTGGAITDHPNDERVEAVDLVEPAALRSLDLRPPVAAALVEAIDKGFTGELSYLGSAWVDEPAP
jgi:ADP-ribose pyrophosphatase YjhB (NUDIX family)